MPNGTDAVFVDAPWADIVLDLRPDNYEALPRTFTGRRKAHRGSASIAGTRRETSPDQSYGIYRWTDESGFTGGLAVPLQRAPGFPRIDHVLPHAQHLTAASPGRPYKNVSEPRERGERVLMRALPLLRRVLSEEAHTQPSQMQRVISRFAWASVGVEDIGSLPNFLTHDPQTSASGILPTALRSVPLVAAWQRSGFSGDVNETAEWMERSYRTLDAVRFATTARRRQIEFLATFKDAGFDAEEGMAWMAGSQYNPGNSTPRTVSASVCTELRREHGITPADLTHLTSGIEPTASASVAARHVSSWLRVSPSVERVCCYIAAGVGIKEARRLERSAEQPSLDQLRMLAALRLPAGAPAP